MWFRSLGTGEKRRTICWGRDSEVLAGVGRSVGERGRACFGLQMGDSRGIDMLRALALSSMPSMAGRPLSRTNSRSSDVVDPRRPPVSAAVRPKSDDKEEGELSSDDEAELSAAPLAAAESSMSDAHRPDRLSSQGIMMDERHTSAATSADFAPHVGVSSASAFSASARVSIVNKPQLLSAFTAQAPTLIPSHALKPVHSGRLAGGSVVNQANQANVQVTSSHAEVRSSSLSAGGRGAWGNPSPGVPKAAFQPTVASLGLSQEHQNVPNGDTGTCTSLRSVPTQKPVSLPKQVLSSKVPVPPTALPNVAAEVPSLAASVAANGAGESKNAPGLAHYTAAISGVDSGNPVHWNVQAGSDVSKFLGKEQPVCASTSAVVGFRAVRKEAGVRNEAEAFLASLRLPLRKPEEAVPNSADDREDAFLIKFDDDGDSDGENESPQTSASKGAGRSMRKGPNSGVVLRNGNAVPQSNPVMPNQVPSALHSEIDRMKKQIAAMERNKSTTIGPAGLGRSSKVLSGDPVRHTVHPPTEPKSAVQVAVVNTGLASADLESMRLQILAKETEIQQQKQRLAVKGPENAKGANDVKGTGPFGGPPLSTVRPGQAGVAVVTQMNNSFGKPSPEEGIVGYRKEVQLRAEGVSAHPSSGLGANRPESRAVGGDNDKRVANGLPSVFTASQGPPHVSEVSGLQTSGKGMKRSHPDGGAHEILKVPRLESSPRKKTADEEMSQEAVHSLNANDTFEARDASLPLNQSSIHVKRKVDALPVPSSKAAPKPVAVVTASPAFEAAKKVKTDSAAAMIESRRDVREVVNANQSGQESEQGVAAFLTTTDAAEVSTSLAGEQIKAAFQNRDTSELVAQSPLGYLATRTESAQEADGAVEICKGKLETSMSPPLTAATEVRRHINAQQKRPLALSTSSDGVHSFGVNGSTDVSGFQPPVHGREMSSVSPRTHGNTVVGANLTQPAAKPRRDEFYAIRTETASAERESMPLGTSNPHSVETNRLHTTISWRPVNPMSVCAQTSAGYNLEHSLRAGLSGIDEQSMDAGEDSFQQLLEEEEMLDKELEEVQEARRRCERRERAARKEYREAQQALRLANADCDLLNQRKEVLLSRLHAAGARQWSKRPLVGRPMVPYGGNPSPYPQGTIERFLPQVAAPNPMAASRVEELSWEIDTNHDRGTSAQIQGSLASLSYNRVDIAAISQMHAQTGPTAEQDEVSGRTLVTERSVDGRGEVVYSADGLGVESMARKEDHSCPVEQAQPVPVGWQEDVQVGLAVGDKSHLVSQQLTGYSDVFDPNGGQKFLSSEVNNTVLELSESPAQDENMAMNKTTALESLGMEDIEAATQRMLPSSSAEFLTDSCSLDHVGDGGRRGATSLVCAEEIRLVDVSQAKVPSVLDVEQAMGGEVGHQAVEQSPSTTASKDADPSNSVHSAPETSVFTQERNIDGCHELADREEGTLLPLCNAQADDIPEVDLGSSADPPRVDGSYMSPATTTVADGQVCSGSEIPDPSAHTSEGIVYRGLPEEPLSSQVVLDDDNSEGEICEDDKVQANYPTLEANLSSVDLLDNLCPASGAGTDGPTANIELSADGSNDQVVDPNEECPVRLLSIASELPDEVSGEDDLAKTEDTRWVVSDAEQDHATLADSFVNGVLVQPEEKENVPTVEPSVQVDSPNQSVFCVELHDKVVQHDSCSKGSNEAQKVHVADDVQFLAGDGQRKSVSLPDEDSHLVDVHADTENALLAEGSHDISSDMPQSPIRIQPPDAVKDVCDHDTSSHVNELMCAKDGRLGSDVSLVGMLLAEARAQDCSMSETRPEFSDERHLVQAHHPASNEECTSGDVLRGFHSENTVAVQDGCKDARKIMDSDPAIVKSKCLSQDHDLVMAGGSEGERQDQVKMDRSEQNDSVGADVETFRKALRDEDAFGRSASGGEVVAAGNSQQVNGDQFSKRILAQSPHHRLDHLLDIVEVRGLEIPRGDDIVGMEDTLGTDTVAMSGVGNAVQLDASPPESRGAAFQLSEVASTEKETLPSAVPDNSNGNEAKRQVPSAAYLTVIGCIPRDARPPPESYSWPNQETALVHFGKDSQPAPNNISLGLSRYESPLTVFRSCRTLPQFAGRLKCHSTTWSHAISPFKSLCKFEHRGKCNNDDCPWQHADDYTLLSSDIDSQMKNYNDLQTRLSSDGHATAGQGIHTSADLASEAFSLPSQDPSVSAVIAQAQISGREAFIPNSSEEWSTSLPMNWIDCEALVPTYRTSSYPMKAENRVSFLSYKLQLNRKVDSFRSFLFSPSVHKQLPLDAPCLLDTSQGLSSLIESPAFRPKSPHWRYMGELQEKLTSTKDRGAPVEAISEEVWLELALHHIDYDIRTENYRARDQALYYLSRALESKTNSVSLWTLYSCLFYMRDEDPEKDDMFRHAVQYNQGSYVLWVLYINSKLDLQSRVEASENAVIAIVDDGMQSQRDKCELSACILDIVLQMLYYWSVSRRWEDFSSWVDDLIYEGSSSQGDPKSHRGCTAALLSHLTQHDACVLWIACTYCLACARLPNGVILRLGCKQELPDALNWEEHAKFDEVTRKRVMTAMNTALGRGPGCLSLESDEAKAVDEESLPRQTLAVNYVQCILLYEGLERAASMGQELRRRFPNSLELIVLCARIDQRRKGLSAGLHVFEDAIRHWSREVSGVQCLWNQYAGHALLWGGPDLAKTSFLKCVATANLHSVDGFESSSSRCKSMQSPHSVMTTEQNERIRNDEVVRETWNGLRECFVAMTSAYKRADRGAGRRGEQYEHENSVFSLINLALIEVLNEDVQAARFAILGALQAAISHKDLRHCWRELAALQLISPKKTRSPILDLGMLSVLDKCKTDALLQLTPLCQKAFQDFRRPHIRKFFEDLLGPLPLDNSILNSILHIFYGSRLLPLEIHALKEVFHFAEGLLEAIPGNVPLALSLCKIVQQHSATLKQTYMSTAVWACALLTSALVKSCPHAPEVYWVEAGSILRQLVGEKRSLEEFYGLGLSIYPFSAALQQGLEADRGRPQNSDGDPARVMRRSPPVMAVPKPTQGAVECRQVEDVENGCHRPVRPSES